MSYAWPGNVRELVNAIEYAVVMAKGVQIMPSDLPDTVQRKQAGQVTLPQQQAGETLSLKDTERDLIIKALKECRGNKHLAAKILRIPRSTLYSKIQKHGIVVAEKSESDSLSCSQNKLDDKDLAIVQN